MNEAWASSAFLSVPAVLQAAKGACPLHTGPQDWDAHAVTQPTHRPGQVLAHVISLSLWDLPGSSDDKESTCSASLVAQTVKNLPAMQKT